MTYPKINWVGRSAFYFFFWIIFFLQYIRPIYFLDRSYQLPRICDVNQSDTSSFSRYPLVLVNPSSSIYPTWIPSLYGSSHNGMGQVQFHFTSLRPMCTATQGSYRRGVRRKWTWPIPSCETCMEACHLWFISLCPCMSDCPSLGPGWPMYVRPSVYSLYVRSPNVS